MSILKEKKKNKPLEYEDNDSGILLTVKMIVVEDVEADPMTRDLLFTSVQQTCSGNIFVLSDFCGVYYRGKGWMVGHLVSNGPVDLTNGIWGDHKVKI